jgi:type VI secretion system protein ImpK
MREEIANLVYPVLSHGMSLKERLEFGHEPDLDREQAELKRLLGTEVDARRWSDYGGDYGPDNVPAGAARGDDAERRGADHFLGIRYALVCWLDELFVLDSPWESQWNERKLEGELYGTNDRAWKFWEQARRAETQPGSDALEVFFLCVILGFRGDLRDEPNRLQAWVAGTQIRVTRSQGKQWPYPAELQAPTYVPPLRGRERLQKLVLAAGALLLFVIPVTLFILIQQLGQ